MGVAVGQAISFPTAEQVSQRRGHGMEQTDRQTDRVECKEGGGARRRERRGEGWER